jgi:hypothetical protein
MLPKKNDIDPIVDEIHQTRRRIAEKFGYDIDAISEDARRRQAASGRPVWRGPSLEEPQAPSMAAGDSQGESFLDLLGKAAVLRSGEDIDAQIEEERQAWNEG